jgi:FlaA1/EpsC-like NDP-sugar epimerase/lipopolysaccharide/colanic/teichoic acid biosynthesis glycosyltransferase
MRTLKRLFDIFFSLLGLVFLSPLLCLSAIAIKMQDGGPVFFKQERIGKGLRPFKMYKFRSMTPETSGTGLSITIGGDARVTRFGRVIRKLKVDELPQLINVLKGDMSLVGPRPEVWKYVNHFISDFREVLKVRPGITDYASIIYHDEEEVLMKSDDPENFYLKTILPAKIELNKRYVREMSIVRDVDIIVRTFGALFQSRVSRYCRAFLATLGEFMGDAGKRFYTVKEFIITYRRFFVFFFHASAVALANYAAFSILFEGAVPPRLDMVVPYSVLLVLAVRLPLFKVFGLYKGLWRYTGISDVVRIVLSVTVGTLVYMTLARAWLTQEAVPLSVIALDWLLTLAFINGTRLLLRIYEDYVVSDKQGKKVLIIGAGNAGEMIVRDMRKNLHLHNPVGFVDDDRRKKGLSIHGVPILGSTEDLLGIITEYRPEEVLIAVPSAKPETMMALMKRLAEYKLPIKTLPSMSDIINGHVSINQIKPLELEDLMARPPVQADRELLGGFIKGRTVMVTGAGGSIGSEICRQALALGAKAVIAYERHENSLYNLDMEVRTKDRNAPLYPIIGDVNDRHRLDEIFSTYAPDTVFHAAAHKHVPMMEVNPREAIYNNILGTRKCALIAGEHGVERFVLISTDKAVNPSSIMGASKRACELVVHALNEDSDTKYMTVRFGNVLGSSGSVVPLFREQIKRGGPVTVTHPDIVRFLMLIPEAVQLVLQAASIGQGGEIFVLDMGEPMKIADLARHLIVLSGYVPDKDIKLEYIGLRPGEKLYEELFDKSEDVSLTKASKVFRAISKDLPDRASITKFGNMLEHCVVRKDTDGMLRQLCRLVNTYTYNGQVAAEQEIRKAA